MTKILVIEDHALVREGLLVALKRLDENTLTLGAADANEATRLLETEDIDLVTLDLMLPGIKGLSFLPVLRRRFPSVPVVILSAVDNPDTISLAIKAGASGFIPKTGSTAELLNALRAVLAGEIYLPSNMQIRADRSEVARHTGDRIAQRFGVTAAQARVLALVAEGCTNRQIAEVLGLTEGTVKLHVSAILKTLNLSNRSEVALLVNRKSR